MNPQTTPPPDPLVTMLHNATIDKAEKSEFSNSARDMFKFVMNNHYTFHKDGENQRLSESSDVFDYLRKTVPLFVSEVLKNDQSRPSVGETTATEGNDSISQAVTSNHSMEGDPVDIMDIVPSEPSSLPVSSMADLYTRSMLKCLAGFPLYDPKPLSELSKEYLRHGVNVGDVGFVRGDGTFDFLFNICPSRNGLTNPPNLPDSFSFETSDHSATRDVEPLPRNTCLFQSPVTRTKFGEYICEGPEGAILELPEGATQEEAMNIRPFAKLAARHGVKWYEYTMNRGRDISNGSLYLITSSTKCTQWGTAIFDRPCTSGQGLKFEKKSPLRFGKSTSKYHWKGSRAFLTKVSNTNKGDAPNQCVFLRGYKIMIRQDIFDNLCNDQPSGSDSTKFSSSSQGGSTSPKRQRAHRIRGGGGTDPMSKILTGGGLFSRTTQKSEKVVLHPNFNSSLVHPSDIVNSTLLSQKPGAKVALTHDDVWCNLLRDNFQKLDYATLINVARSYTTYIDEYDCVSLEKSSDLSYGDENSGPLQENLTLQSPILEKTLPTPDEGSTSATALILPCELVERILLLLDTKSMLTCRLVNREFNSIIQSSTLLQYFLACKAAGVIDNPRSSLSYAERLKALEKREDAWRRLDPMFETMIKVNHQPSSVYELTGGAYLLTDNDRRDIYYCHLPSFPQDNPQWKTITGHGPGQDCSGIIVDMGLAVHEHDLIVNIISSEVGNQADVQQYSLDLVLLKFSTGEYHPLARHPRIHVQRSPSSRPRVTLRIVGDNLAFIVNGLPGTFPDELFIFDWKTGHRRLQHKTTEYAFYSGLVFISPELLLVPNSVMSHFEIWHIPPSHHDLKPPVQILSLQLPAVSSSHSTFFLECHGGPSPYLHSIPYFPPRPFFPSPESSIIGVNIRFESFSGFADASYTLIMHRSALLDAIQKWTSPSLLEQRESLPTWLTNEVTVQTITDPNYGSVRLDTQSRLVSMIRSLPRTDSPPPLTSLTSHIPSESGSESISLGSSTSVDTTSRKNFLQVPWSDWGPSISRWFQLSDMQARYSMISNAQRCAFLFPHPNDRMKSMVYVVDFNRHNFKRIARKMEQEGEDDFDNGNTTEEGKVEEGSEMLDHDGVFSEDVYMGLQCVVYHAPGEYDFDVVLMDEERLLGLKNNDDFKTESIQVLYFG